MAEPLARRLRRLLVRPLWRPAEDGYRVQLCHFLVGAPVVLLGAVPWGIGAAVRLDLHWAAGAAGSAVGALALLHLQVRSVPLARRIGRRVAGGSGSEGAELAWHAAAGGAAGLVLAATIGATPVGAAGLALGLGGTYAFLAGVAVCGEGPARVFAFLAGDRRRPGARETDLSHEASLVQRGELEAAVAAYRSRIEERPSDPRPYFLLARLLAEAELARFDEAVAVLERARKRATLETGQEVRVLRRAAEIWIHRARRPRRAAPLLARLLERHPDADDARWARRELDAIKRLIADEEP